MIFGLSVLAVVALALAAAGVVGSVLPALPGGLLSLAGVLLYWYSTGYTDPSLLVFVALVLTAGLTVAVDWLGGIAAAKVGGASTRVSLVAGLVGLVLFVVTGPLGLFLGVAGTVFIAEYLKAGDAAAGVRSAVYTTLGLLATSLVQGLLTFGVLIGLVLAVVF